MIASSIEAETQGTANLCMSTAQPAQHVLHVGDEGPVFSMSTTFADILNASRGIGHSGVSMPGAKDDKVLEEDFTANHEHQFAEPLLGFHDQDYFEKIQKLQFYLDVVSNIVKPGCSHEVLNMALNSMSSVVGMLSMMSSSPFPHSSL